MKLTVNLSFPFRLLYVVFGVVLLLVPLVTSLSGIAIAAVVVLGLASIASGAVGW
jgi:hypothetical protein